MPKFPFYKQLDAMDCGPTCLRMVAKFHGRHYSLNFLRTNTYADREGVSVAGISEAAELIGFQTMAVGIDFDTLSKEADLPCIVHWKQNHFVVVYKITKNKVFVADPAFGKIKYDKAEFLKNWLSNQKKRVQEGVVLLLYTTPDFYAAKGEKINKTGFGFLWRYTKKYNWYIFQLVLALLLGSILQLIFPFLTQALVDWGINKQNIGFVYLVLMAQMMLFLGLIAITTVQSWILLHVSARINITLIADFLRKLMRLPIAFFDAKITGDLLQRIDDHKRIELFLTGSALTTLFALVNLLVFAGVLGWYNWSVMMVFVGGSVAHFAWVLLFLKQRKILDHKRFEKMADNQNALIQLIQAMPVIKQNNYEQQKRWQWEGIQAALFKVSIKSLRLEQYQQIGALCINELKNIIIVFMAAKSVVTSEMSLGMMLAVMYILGQLNGPMSQIIAFLQTAQDAKISLERLGEIHNKKEELEEGKGEQLKMMPEKGDLKVANLSFAYTGSAVAKKVLKNINAEFKEGQITAIVGTSGSGKTTLMKLLLKFYKPIEGKITLDNNNLNGIDNKWWRNKCGVVLQDDFVFSDSIARNIAMADEIIDQKRLRKAVEVANVKDFIESLPLGYNTIVGQKGGGMSGGQKQRLFIARAVYKNPDFLFFDEATNALDTENERIIMGNLQQFFKGKTVVVVAHRLSTVKNAHQILVLHQGEIVEKGTHVSLVKKQGYYFNLVKNQLDLGG